MASTESLYVIDIETGKILHKNDNFDASIISNSNDNDEVDFDLKNIKKGDDKIMIDIFNINQDGEMETKNGTVILNYDDYSIKYEK